MRITNVLLFALLLSGSCALGQNAAYDPPLKTISVRAKILARSTSVHHSFAGGQEVYLAEISRRREHDIVKLVDTYPDADSPIRTELLHGLHPFRMKLTRNFDCDVKAGLFFLGRESLLLDPTIPEALRSRDMDEIPCYTVDHNATRLAK
jgi:hypothetical protein